MDNHSLGDYYFISYSSTDREIALKIKEDLEKQGISIWLDQKEIRSGDEWRERIRLAVRDSRAVLYLVSPTSRTSRYVAHEIAYAETYKKTVFPLWIAGENWAEVVAFGMEGIQNIDLRKDAYKTEIKKLLIQLQEQSVNQLQGLNTTGVNGYMQNKPEVTRPVTPEEINKKENAMSQSSSYTTLSRFIKRSANTIFSRKTDFSAAPGQQVSPQIQPTESIPPRNPYKGLYAFTYRDAHDFFGRQKLIQQMVEKIQQMLKTERSQLQSQLARCMLVVGASGSGKSSLVMAGLLPELEKQREHLAIKRWFFLEPVTPGNDPLNALAYALNTRFLNDKNAGRSELERWKRAQIRQMLDKDDARGLITLLQQITTSTDDRIVLVIDQFEEIFAPGVNTEQRENFINLLLAAATEPNLPILIVFTLRADFYDRILLHEKLQEQTEQYKIDIPPMTRDELRQVIEEPAQQPDVQVSFDRYLAEDLLYEVSRRPEALPLLQFTLEKLFEAREDRLLTRRCYEELGGMQGAVNKQAEDTYQHKLLTPEHQEEARKLFTEYFIHIAEAYDQPSRLEAGEEIMRRRVSQAELELDNPAQKIRAETIEAFIQARLLTSKSTIKQSANLENSSEITYEISHEALINAWERLRNWIEEDRKDIYFMQNIRPRVKEWLDEPDKEKKKNHLAERLVLQQLQEYKTRKKFDAKVEHYFLESRRERKKQNITLATSMVIPVVVLLIIGFIGYNQLIAPSSTVVTTSTGVGPGSIYAAVANAHDGDTITFTSSLNNTTIKLTNGNLVINKSLTIRANPNQHIKITSGLTGNYVYIEKSSDAIFDHLSFVDSYTYKYSFITNDGTLTIKDSQVSNNRCYDNGGAITNNGHLNLNKTRMLKNSVSGNGGAINNIQGIIDIEDSLIYNNYAGSNGGGIYSQGGLITLSQSEVHTNTVNESYGGGVAVVNGELHLSNTKIYQNDSKSYGGGIAIQGGLALISDSAIYQNNANLAGGGIVVTQNPDNGFTSLVTIRKITITDNPDASYYIGQNTLNHQIDHYDNIIGQENIKGGTLQINDNDPQLNPLGPSGNPPVKNPPQMTTNFLGYANIDQFCQQKHYSYGELSKQAQQDPSDIIVTCQSAKMNESPKDFSGQKVCQDQFAALPNINPDSIIDRLASHDDPTSLQCYKNLKRLSNIPVNESLLNDYCKTMVQDDTHYTGIYNNTKERTTAYDWKCQPDDSQKLPGGLGVANACDMNNPAKNSIDRLVDYNKPDGWECWAPE